MTTGEKGPERCTLEALVEADRRHRCDGIGERRVCLTMEALATLPTKHGDFRVVGFEERRTGVELRAYALQEQGLDTVDANLALGFRADERDYAPAAHMLASLRVESALLLTNNPDKVRQLEAYGVRIAARIPHLAPANEHCRRYLETKARRCGHLLSAAVGSVP